MGLNKQECINAVNDIEYDLCELEALKTGVNVYCIYNENIEIVKNLIDEHFEFLEVIKKESDDIQKVIDLLSSKIVTTNYLNIAIKKLEVIQDELAGMIEDD